MDPYKTNKLGAAIQRILGELLVTRVKDPRVGFVTISGVELNRDHSVAKVYFSLLDDADGSRETTVAGLKQASGFLQSQVGRILKLRNVPELRFVPDPSLDRSFAVETVLRDLEARGEFASELDRRRQRTLADFVPPRELLDPLREAGAIWIAPHWNPDPDAMGCALALAEALRRLDKEVTVWRYPDPPPGLPSLPGWDACRDIAEAPALLAAAPPDLGVLTDCHRTDRLGPLQEAFDRLPRVVCVDHHLVSGRRAPAPGWVDDRAEACATLVHQVVAALSAGAADPLTLDIATNLFAGLVGDTGGFRFGNTLPMSFTLAHDLAQRGVDIAGVTHRVLHLRRRSGLDLLQRALATCVWSAGGKIVTAYATQAMLQEIGASAAETEGFVSLLGAVEGVRYAAFLREIEPQVWRVSLRADRDGDVQSLAAAHGGGGHRQASGCTLHGSREVVAAEVARALAAQP